MDLVQGISQNIATYNDGDVWADGYDIDYPLVIDPEALFEPTMDTVYAAFPTNILVDTRTMTIVDVVAGVPETAFWNKYDDLATAQ